MSQRATQIGITILFAGLLAAPLMLKQSSSSSIGVAGETSALSRYGFQFEEAAEASGVRFTHQAPELDSRLEHIMPEVASLGAAVSVVDFNRDGWEDFYATNSRQGSANALYQNLANGRFRDVAAEIGLADVNRPGTGVSMGSVWGDYDNDGYEDVFLYKWGQPELFHNDAGRRFTRASEGAGLPAWVNANTAIWFDYDRDGLLDLFLGGYYSEEIDLWHLASSKIMPNSFEYAVNGGRNYLLHNLGAGRFEEVAERLGINSRRWSLAAVAADLHGTGYPDLFVANDYGVNELFLNRGGESFREAGKETGIGYTPKSGMNAAVGDVLNQGRFSLYVSNISEEGVLVQGNSLWVPARGAEDGKLVFGNVANAMGVELGGWSFGAQFGDLNNDGFTDLYLTNGYVSQDRQHDYWYDFSKITAGHEAIISDAANWPALDGRSLAGYQQKRIWLNDGAGRFQEVAQRVGVTDVFDGRAVALADFGNRGALDVVSANQRGPLLLYKNTVQPGRHWIQVALEGRVSNRSAIGAEVHLFWDGQQQVQQVTGGSGFAGQNQRRLHFGLGDASAIDRLEIRWPSGIRQTIDAPPVDQLLRIQEPLE